MASLLVAFQGDISDFQSVRVVHEDGPVSNECLISVMRACLIGWWSNCKGVPVLCVPHGFVLEYHEDGCVVYSVGFTSADLLEASVQICGRSSVEDSENGWPEYLNFLPVSSDELRLKSMAQGYSLALYSHCNCLDPKANRLLLEYLKANADWVAGHPKRCVIFLKKRGVDRIDWKHLQFFFSACPPIYEPYVFLLYEVLSEISRIGLISDECAVMASLRLAQHDPCSFIHVDS